MTRLLNVARARPLWLVLTALLALFGLLFPLTIDVGVLQGRGTSSFFVQPRVAVLYFSVWVALGSLLLLVNWRWLGTWPALLRSSPTLIALVVALLAFASAPLWATLTDVQTGYHGPSNRGDGAWMFVISFIFSAFAARLVYLFRPAGSVVTAAYALAAGLVGWMSAYQGGGGDLWALFGLNQMSVLTGSATMGSPVFITVLTGMTLVMGLTLWTSWSPTNRSQWLLWSLGLPVSGWFAYSIVASGGRSAIVGTAVVLLVWLALSLIAARPTSALRVAPLMALATAVMLGAYLGSEAGGRGADKLRELGMLLSEDRADESNATTRVMFYRAALDSLLKQPLQPHGVNSFVAVVWEAQPKTVDAMLDHYNYVPKESRALLVREGPTFFYPDPVSGQWLRRDTLHDKVHNYILDVWLAFGFIPLLALIALLGFSWFRMLAARTPLSLGAAAALAVYAIYAQAWFPAPATDPLLFILLGIGWGDAERALRPTAPEEEPVKLSRAEFRRLKLASK